METMIYFKILETNFIVKVFVELQKENESTVKSFACLKTIAYVIWIEMQCMEDKITYEVIYLLINFNLAIHYHVLRKAH